jgi:hypothetical protein
MLLGTLIKECEEHFGDLTDKIAHEFSVSKVTVNRWRENKNAPHETMVPFIVGYLNELMINKSFKESYNQNDKMF